MTISSDLASLSCLFILPFIWYLSSFDDAKALHDVDLQNLNRFMAEFSNQLATFKADIYIYMYIYIYNIIVYMYVCMFIVYSLYDLVDNLDIFPAAKGNPACFARLSVNMSFQWGEWVDSSLCKSPRSISRNVPFAYNDLPCAQVLWLQPIARYNSAPTSKVDMHYTVDGRNPKQPRGMFVKPCQKWNKLPTNWCRMSSLNSITQDVHITYIYIYISIYVYTNGCL